MKKKCYIAFLVLVLTVSAALTGCKGAEKDVVSEELAEEETEEEETEDDLDSEKEEKDTEKDDEETEETEETDKDAEKIVPIKATRREIRDDMFVNETFGISFPITEDMNLLDDSKFLETLGVDTDSLEEGELLSAKEMENALNGILYDAVIFLAEDSNSNITISYENLDVTMNGNYPDERRFAKILEDDLEQQSPGLYNIKSRKTINIGDVQYLREDLEIKGSELKEIFCCRRVENYMVCITITYEEEKSQAAEDFIASLNADEEGGRGDISSAQSISGTVEDDYYINETFDIRFPITDNMSIMSASVMERAQGIGGQYLESEGIVSSEQLEKASDGTLYDLAIYLEDGVSNIAVCYENMDITSGGISTPDEEMYGKMLRFTLSRVDSFDYEFIEDSRVTLGGKEYYRMDFDVDIMGMDVHQIYIFRQVDNYMASFVITYRDGMEQQVEDFLDSITGI